MIFFFGFAVSNIPQCPPHQSAADLFVLFFGGSRSGEVMIVSVPFAFQVRSLQGLVKLETELARRTARRAQVKQLKSEKLSPCSRGNLEDSRVIIRENRAVPKDWGQPISFIFSAFKTKLIRLTLVTLRRFPGVSLPRLTTPLVFGQGKP